MLLAIGLTVLVELLELITSCLSCQDLLCICDVPRAILAREEHVEVPWSVEALQGTGLKSTQSTALIVLPTADTLIVVEAKGIFVIVCGQERIKVYCNGCGYDGDEK